MTSETLRACVYTDRIGWYLQEGLPHRGPLHVLSATSPWLMACVNQLDGAIAAIHGDDELPLDEIEEIKRVILCHSIKTLVIWGAHSGFSGIVKFIDNALGPAQISIVAISIDEEGQIRTSGVIEARLPPSESLLAQMLGRRNNTRFGSIQPFSSSDREVNSFDACLLPLGSRDVKPSSAVRNFVLIFGEYTTHIDKFALNSIRLAFGADWILVHTDREPAYLSAPSAYNIRFVNTLRHESLYLLIQTSMAVIDLDAEKTFGLVTRLSLAALTPFLSTWIFPPGIETGFRTLPKLMLPKYGGLRSVLPYCQNLAFAIARSSLSDDLQIMRSRYSEVQEASWRSILGQG